MALDRDAIVRTALDLLDEAGLDGFTTRRLAERLGVKQPAIYWHFRNKRDLLDEMAAEMLVEGRPRAATIRESWAEALKDDARTFRRSLLKYRDGARVHAGTRAGSGAYANLEERARVMCEAGFAPADAIRSMMVMSHYVIGSVIEQQAAGEATREATGKATREATREATSDDASATFTPDSDSYYPTLANGVEQMNAHDPGVVFEFGLDALVSGLAVRLRP